MAVDPTYLKNFHCFENLTEEQRKVIAEIAEAECFYPDHTLTEENQPGKFLYLLAKGEIEVLYNIGDSGPTRVDQMSAGEIVGCAALILPYQYTSTTISLTEIEVLIIDIKALHRLMAEDCPLGFTIQQHVIALLMDRITNFRLSA